jgi:hypothetical protein
MRWCRFGLGARRELCGIFGWVMIQMDLDDVNEP